MKQDKVKEYFVNIYSDFSEIKKRRGTLFKSKDNKYFIFKSDKSVRTEVEKISLYNFLKYRFSFFLFFSAFFFNGLLLYSYPILTIFTHLGVFLYVKLYKAFSSIKKVRFSYKLIKFIIIISVLCSTYNLFYNDILTRETLILTQMLFYGDMIIFTSFYFWSFPYRYKFIYRINNINEEENFFIWRGIYNEA